jgi:quinol monooxygenase YgiN
MATVVFIHRLQPADGKRDALIGLLREFADSIKRRPGMPSLFGPRADR